MSIYDLRIHISRLGVIVMIYNPLHYSAKIGISQGFCIVAPENVIIGCFLTPTERENLPYAVALFPFMQCVRFLTDYINGDSYYKIKYPTHNLERARNQLAFFEKVKDLK